MPGALRPGRLIDIQFSTRLRRQVPRPSCFSAVEQEHLKNPRCGNKLLRDPELFSTCDERVEKQRWAGRIWRQQDQAAGLQKDFRFPELAIKGGVTPTHLEQLMAKVRWGLGLRQ